jgi:hypothetical protein
MSERKYFWDTLRERQVPKTLGVYLGASWLLLQIVDIAKSTWSLPDGVLQGIFLLLALGIPVVIFGAWLYNIDGKKLARNEDIELDQFVKRRGATRKLGLFTFSIFLCLIAIFGLLHLWPDEDLNPRLYHLLNSSGQYRDHPLNLAYGLYGFSAPLGSQPHTYGHYITDAYKVLGKVPEIESRMRFTVEHGDLCRLDKNCGQQGLENLAGTPALLEANAEMLVRYRALRQHGMFNETIQPTLDSPAAPFRELYVAQALMQTEALYLATKGDSEQAWSIANNELNFHRTMLGSADTLAAKSIAMRLVEGDLRLRIMMLNQRIDAPPAWSVTHRLDDPERSTVSSMGFEINNVSRLLFNPNFRAEAVRQMTRMTQGEVSSRNRFLIRILPFRPNAAANRMLLPMLEVAESSMLDAVEFENWVAQITPPKTSLVQYLTNGAGVLATSWDPHLYTFYLRRPYELDRLIVLAQLAESIIRGGVTKSKISGWLLATSPSQRDPLTGKPAYWREGTLAFDVESADPWIKPELNVDLSNSDPVDLTEMAN